MISVYILTMKLISPSAFRISGFDWQLVKVKCDLCIPVPIKLSIDMISFGVRESREREQERETS